jgi:hypothetical protein
MSERKKGFDPLSSLFDAPDPGAVKQDVAPTPVDITKPERRIAVPPPPPPPSIPASLEMEDAPTEMAMMSEVENRSDLNEEVAGAGPLKKRPSESTKVEFIGELPASDDWTESKPEALFSLALPRARSARRAHSKLHVKRHWSSQRQKSGPARP